ncbi:hypothetical protein [Streptomyces misionensis]|uniref:hypothetical protein n=1 Tax=Streptomyces misionensis TaxID=67331 RepID=UPI000A931F53
MGIGHLTATRLLHLAAWIVLDCRVGTAAAVPAGEQPACARARRRRPPGIDEVRYKKHNMVGRTINRLKRSRAVETRYDKRGYVFLGTATAATLVIRLRT